MTIPTNYPSFIWKSLKALVLDREEVERVARWATGDLRPHLTVLLDIHPERVLGGIADKDRLEAAGAELHERARAEFLALAARDPEHYLVLGARQDRETIARQSPQLLRPHEYHIERRNKRHKKRQQQHHHHKQTQPEAQLRPPRSHYDHDTRTSHPTMMRNSI